ncbi:serine/threonine kinase [Minicystis rosea]|nr:serine/threonine kinase [Minicystis rosea]
MDKKPWWPVAVGLGALAVMGGTGGYFWWKRAPGNTPKPTTSGHLGALPAAVSAKLAANRGSCPEGMVFVPGGTFTMGSPDGEGNADEHPAHSVTLPAFCIGGTEVTVSAYRECVNSKRGDLQCTAPRNAPSCNWNSAVARARHPVNCVGWAQADTYCKWAGGTLPTEAQWEYAARGTDGRKYPWGNDAPQPDLLNACGGECRGRARKTMFEKNDGFSETAPVGSFLKGASPFGALDMGGNVSEWIGDPRAPYPGGQPFPKDPDAEKEGGQATYSVRGGSYLSGDPNQARAAARLGVFASGMVSTGFRCVHQP